MEKYLLSLIRLLLTVMSPDIRKNLEAFVNGLAEQAKKTPNEWDDLFVSMLKSVLGMKTE